MIKNIKLNKVFFSFIVISLLAQVVFPDLLFATKRAQFVSIHELIDRSELILLVQPTEIVDEPSNKILNKPAGGWARLQVLEVWKGSLKKKEFTMGWGYYNYFGYGERIRGKMLHVMFLRRGPRKYFFETEDNWSIWPVHKIKFPGLDDKKEAIVYQDPIDHFVFPLTGKVLLRDVITMRETNGEPVYGQAIMLNELRLYIKDMIEALEEKKKTTR